MKMLPMWGGKFVDQGGCFGWLEGEWEVDKEKDWGVDEEIYEGVYEGGDYLMYAYI